MRELARLIFTTPAAAAFVAVSYVSLTVGVGLLPGNQFVAAGLRHSVWGAVGVLALALFALFALTGRRMLPLSLESVLQCAAVVVAVTMVFGLSEEQKF